MLRIRRWVAMLFILNKKISDTACKFSLDWNIRQTGKNKIIRKSIIAKANQTAQARNLNLSPNIIHLKGFKS